MPNYVKEMRHKFQHDRPSQPEHAPYRWNRPTYGPGPQLPEPEDDSPPLDAKGINEIQQVVGSSLHCGRAIDSTILPALNSISAEQSKATERTRQDAKKLLDYLATHPDAVIRYVKSDMILHVHMATPPTYQPRNQEASSERVHFYLSSRPKHPHRQPDSSDPMPPMNGAILVNANIIKHVMSSQPLKPNWEDYFST